MISFVQLWINKKILGMTDFMKSTSNQSYSISAEGLRSMLNRPRDPEFPARNILWTDDFRVELPIRKTTSGPGSEEPITLIDQFRRVVKQSGSKRALSVKRNNQWHSLTFKEYYQESMNFAASLIAHRFPEHTSINIIGFNSPEWAITFYGSLFGRCLPTGIYTTNSDEVCEYIVENSECKVVVSENMQYAKKYLKKMKEGEIKLIIIYNDPEADLKSFGGKIVHWKDFMKEGRRVDMKYVEERMNASRPGNCATLVYTSGTTGMPKGVMLSHDNFTFTKKSMDEYHKRDEPEGQFRIVSYLPLSHVAGLFADLITPVMNAYHVFFAAPDALQGSLIGYLQEVKPHAFFSVPRVWQKIQQQMKKVAKENGWLKTKIATWAKEIGSQGTMQEVRKQPTSLQFRLAKTIVYNQVKKKLGLDECHFYLYGSAPLDPIIRQYFLSLNFFLINSYGMSESTGPQNFSNIEVFDYKDVKFLKEVGSNIPGTEIKIMKEKPNDEQGQICYRGRNRFMGYYKKAEETHKTIDAEGYLHSGDLGRLDKDNVLFITGRAKELIITAGGQNIPPVLIENQIKQALPFIANVMAVGQMKKYLACLITLKEDPPMSGKLQKLAQELLQSKGCPAKTVSQAIKHPKMREIITAGLEAANSKAISRAQRVQNFIILPEDFSVEAGLLTPTLKLKRRQVSKKYHAEIEKMYITPSM